MSTWIKVDKDGRSYNVAPNATPPSGGGIPQAIGFHSYEEPVCIINVDALPKLLKQFYLGPDSQTPPEYGLWINFDYVDGFSIYYEAQRIILAGNGYYSSWFPFKVVYEDGGGIAQQDMIVPMKIGNTIFVYENFRSDTFQPLVPYQESQNGLRVEYYTDDGQDNPVPHLLQPGETNIPADAFTYIDIFPDENNSNGFVQEDSVPISEMQEPISDVHQVNLNPGDTVSFNTILIDYTNKTICAHRYTVTMASK